MDDMIKIIGNEASIIYYNLNNQFSNIRKIIITKEILINSFENEKVRTLFNNLSSSSRETYKDILLREKSNGAFDGVVNNDLYKEIQEYLPQISQNMMEIQLKDYNFMSSISNARFNLVLRCENFSITKYYEEKGQLMSGIKNLIKEYLEFEGNIFRISRLENFQIEIYESLEIYKYITLKKEGNSILLSSSYSFPRNFPIDYGFSQEFYFSVGDDFQFYRNMQDLAIIREQNKLVEKPINDQEKILSNEELMLINEKTKNINDAMIEIVINPKGVLKILNVSIIENNIFPNSSEDGFIINKSSKNYDRISLITLRDNFNEELPNPKYLLIRNDSEIKELISGLSILNSIDGIIFNTNIYSTILDRIGRDIDIDIIFFNKTLQKSLDLKIDFENMRIDGLFNDNNSRNSNPFSSIIHEKDRVKDEYLERLKNVDLNTPTAQRGGMISNVEDLTRSIISSPESSINMNKLNNNSVNSSTSSLNNNSAYSGAKSAEKLSAISMLANAVLNSNPNNNGNIKNNTGANTTNNNDVNNYIDYNSNDSNLNESNSLNNESNLDSSFLNSTVSSQKMNLNSNDFDNMTAKVGDVNFNDDNRNNLRNTNINSNDLNNNYQSERDKQNDFFSSVNDNLNITSNNSSNNNLNSLSNNDNSFSASSNFRDVEFEKEQAIKNEIAPQDLNSIKDEVSFDSNTSNHNSNIACDLNKYEEILSTNLLTSVNISSSDSFFLDSSYLGNIPNPTSNIYIMTTNKDDILDLSKNYILPISILDKKSLNDIKYKNNHIKNIFLLINSTNEYFLIDETLNVNYFINLSFIDISIKDKFLKSALKRLKNINLIIMKEDLNLIEKYISKVDSIYIKDINSDDEYISIRNKILHFEKTYLMNKFS